MAVMQSEEEFRVPPDVESPRAKLVYLYLSSTDEAHVDELERALGIGKLSLLSILQTLRSRELVCERDGRYSLA